MHLRAFLTRVTRDPAEVTRRRREESSRRYVVPLTEGSLLTLHRGSTISDRARRASLREKPRFFFLLLPFFFYTDVPSELLERGERAASEQLERERERRD